MMVTIFRPGQSWMRARIPKRPVQLVTCHKLRIFNRVEGTTKPSSFHRAPPPPGNPIATRVVARAEDRAVWCITPIALAPLDD